MFCFQFSQNKGNRRYLFKTHPNVLVYCNPVSLFWGVGLAVTEKACLDPTKWKGRNMLGEILTKVRDELMKDPAMQLTESAPVFVKASELLPNSSKGARRSQEEEEEKEEGDYADNELSLRTTSRLASSVRTPSPITSLPPSTTSPDRSNKHDPID